MLTLTETAKEKLHEHLAAQPDLELAIRLSIIGRGKDDFLYDLRAILSDHHTPEDVMIDAGNFQVYVDPNSAYLLEGAVLDVQGDDGGFKVDNPNPVWTDPRGPQIANVIEQTLNPSLAMHGGRIMLVDVRDDVVYVAFGGGCQGCGMASMTLRGAQLAHGSRPRHP